MQFLRLYLQSYWYTSGEDRCPYGFGARLAPGLLLQRLDRDLRTKLKIEMNHPQNFERLVLGCMDSYDGESRLIFQHFRDPQD